MSRLSRLGTVLFLPSKLVEEGCHAVAAWPWADRLSIWVEPGTGTAGVTADVRGAPDWALWLIHHAPQIAGVVLAAAALVAVASGVRPENPLELAAAIAVAGWWAKLVAPERAPPADTETSDNGN